MTIPASLRPLAEAVEGLRSTKTPVILAIDGMSAAGKTTAAALLSRYWGAPVVHMDDFFLPAHLRTEERLAHPGGNVHYERFAAEVLPMLRRKEAFFYRRFRCSTMTYDGKVLIPPAPIVIVEGAYALHPIFGDHADVTAFFAVTPETQRQRILARGGDAAWRASVRNGSPWKTLIMTLSISAAAPTFSFRISAYNIRSPAYLRRNRMLWRFSSLSFINRHGQT